MVRAENKYEARLLDEENAWGKPTEDQEKIVAMTAEINLFKLLQNQICEGGGLCAVLHMCPTNQYGPFNHDQGRHCPKCPLQTLHYYNISTHWIGPKQTRDQLPCSSLNTRNMGCPRSNRHLWSYPASWSSFPKE